MIRNISPVYLDGSVDEVSIDGASYTHKVKNSFIEVQSSYTTGPAAFYLDTIDYNGKPLKPGTTVRVVKTDLNENSIVVSGKLNAIGPGLYNASSVLSSQSDSCTMIYRGATEENPDGEWSCISSDLAGGSSSGWDGTTDLNVTSDVVVTNAGSLVVQGGFGAEGSYAYIGENTIFYQIGSPPTFLKSSANGDFYSPTYTTANTSSCGVIYLAGSWAAGDTITIGNLPTFGAVRPFYNISESAAAYEEGTAGAAFKISSFNAAGSAFTIKVMKDITGIPINSADYFLFYTVQRGI